MPRSAGQRSDSPNSTAPRMATPAVPAPAHIAYAVLILSCLRLNDTRKQAVAYPATTSILGPSGDIFLAFATGNRLPHDHSGPYRVMMLPNDRIDPLFEATAAAVEEAILNALCAAETMTGFQGRTA